MSEPGSRGLGEFEENSMTGWLWVQTDIGLRRADAIVDIFVQEAPPEQDRFLVKIQVGDEVGTVYGAGEREQALVLAVDLAEFIAKQSRLGVDGVIAVKDKIGFEFTEWSTKPAAIAHE
ncbi:hypothetical protein D5S17_09480 [Pseudonocardiaceae bacterium YIM PH 21723]|nr:hypothetical protein D5S17_09480 [Pseudonocardiaceae bacterium YIM PH 21723]